MTDEPQTTPSLTDRMKAVADPSRLRIIALLRVGELTVGDLHDGIGDLSQPTISHHIRVLAEARMITARRVGKYIFYRLTPTAFVKLAADVRGLAG